ncbi:MAG: hypothetical protein J6K96_04125 [Treponema sp.]|nr:hypothetical protein [Treponema sp.]
MNKQLQLNVLTIDQNDFHFKVYSKQFEKFEKDTTVYFSKNNGNIFGHSLHPRENFELTDYRSNENTELTKWYLYNQIINNCNKANFNFKTYDKFQRTIDFILKEDNYGQEVITIIPIYLNSQKKFGFILNYRFLKSKSVAFSREIQKKSLSLDVYGNENKNFYIDKFNKIKDFKNKYLSDIFSINGISVSNIFQTIYSDTLEMKNYQFGNNGIETSQFQGIKKHGPYLTVDTINRNCKICFVYKKEEKNYSYKLYRALEGKLFPTFSGMNTMFHFPLNSNTVIGEEINDYSETAVNELIEKINVRCKNEFVVPIFIVPWAKENATSEQEEIYYKLKHLFLLKNMACQFISIEKIKNDNILKWSISSLAIQIFSKLGGSPWIVIPKSKKCLIIGLGQSHLKDENGHINKFFSYSILTEASGLFRGIRILAKSNNIEDYAKNLSESLKSIINEYSNLYDSFVIHTSFRIKNRDIETIKSVLDEIQKDKDVRLAVLRFDDNHDYMGFDSGFNSLVPLESSKVCLSYNKFLIWFEGQQYGKFAIKHRIGAPVKVTIDYPNKISDSEKEEYLQDAINLSGANWRGFNAKSIPVSLLYAELISHFISAFSKYKLSEINIENLTPWFL